MLNWLLILFLTILSSALLGYITAYKTVIPEAAIYYSVDQNKIVMLSSIISFIYLVLTPLALPWLKQYFSTAVKLSATVIAFGCVNRYILHQNYWASMFLSVLVGIAYIPIITAPYGLLGLFQQKYRAYAASFPIILPSLWVNLVTANGLRYIADTDDEVKSKIHIQKLNIIIAGIAVISAIFIVILMYCLDKQIQKVTQQNKNIQNNTGYIQFFYDQIKDHKQFAVLTICWATIFGINWAYSGMYSVFLDATNLGYPDTLRLSFYANIISFVFSHIFSLVSHKLNFSNNSIIFYINLLGFLASVFLQCSTGFSHPLFHNNRALIVAVIVSRIGFSSFVSLVLVQLSKFGSLILTSSIFFYMANIVNIFSSHFSTIWSTSKYLTYMSWIVLICLVLVYFYYPRNKVHFVETQFEFEDISIDKEKQQNRISYIQ